LSYAAQNGAALWIGPEGGFSPEEETALFAKNAVPITVGNWILRVETAVPALLGYMYAILK
ncbi:MAG: RNA methyltransferase, partial [Victivallales bacterium]|nr:RNA methyltransferase [Victivallales bacterium]